jgi:hypothetical protein
MSVRYILRNHRNRAPQLHVAFGVFLRAPPAPPSFVPFVIGIGSVLQLIVLCLRTTVSRWSIPAINIIVSGVLKNFWGAAWSLLRYPVTACIWLSNRGTGLRSLSETNWPASNAPPVDPPKPATTTTLRQARERNGSVDRRKRRAHLPAVASTVLEMGIGSSR